MTRAFGEGNTHELKCWPEPFQAIIDYRKRYEIRRNDREFESGDTLLLREWMHSTGEYTGRMATCRVGYMTHGGEWDVPADMCIMSIDVIETKL